MSKSNAPHFRPIATPLDVDDDALEQINERLGVPTMVRSVPQPASDAKGAGVDAAKGNASDTPSRKDNTAPRAKKPAAASIAPLKPTEKLTIELPGYLTDELKLHALNRRTSIRHVVMLGLQALGLRIEPDDLVPDARRTRHKTAKP